MQLETMTIRVVNNTIFYFTCHDFIISYVLGYLYFWFSKGHLKFVRKAYKRNLFYNHFINALQFSYFS